MKDFDGVRLKVGDKVWFTINAVRVAWEKLGRWNREAIGTVLDFDTKRGCVGVEWDRPVDEVGNTTLWHDPVWLATRRPK